MGRRTQTAARSAPRVLVVLIAAAASLGCSHPAARAQVVEREAMAEPGAAGSQPATDAGPVAEIATGDADVDTAAPDSWAPVMPPTTPYVPGTLRPCPSRDLGAPRPVSIEGCTSAHCIDGDRGLTICRCAYEINFSTYEWIRVSRGGRSLAQLDLDMAMGGTDQLMAAMAELDGDPGEELLFGGVALWMNGAGADLWLLGILDGLEGTRPRLTRFQSAASGPAAFVRSDADGRCAILATGFHEATLFVYWLYTQPMFYEAAGTLVPAGSLPLIAAPLGDVMRARFGEDGSQPEPRTGPLAWFDAPGTLVMATDPMLMGHVVSSRQVVIGQVADRAGNGGFSATVELRLDGPGGQQVSALIDDPGVEPGTQLIVDLGDAATGRLLPDGYIPADPRRAFQGRHGRLEEFSNVAGYEQNLLWLE